MADRWICPRGHEWDVASGNATPACPECGQLGRPVGTDVSLQTIDFAPAEALLLPASPMPAASAIVQDYQTLDGHDSAPTLTASTHGRPCIAGYEIVGELGRGGMGVVYQARDVRLNRPVAIKMILSGAHATPRVLTRFQTEAETLAQLQHPNIVPIYQVGEHEGQLFLVMPLITGGALARQMDRWSDPHQAAQLVATLADAVQYAHERSILHRDLKPANILLDERAAPHITDFGLATRLGEEGETTRSGEVLGTPSYMAPEQAGGQTQTIGPGTDVYALGAILYELLTGRPPFRGVTALDTIQQVREADPTPARAFNAQVPRDLDTICLKCLAKDPALRYASAGELAADLRRFLEARLIGARPSSLMGRLWQRFRSGWLNRPRRESPRQELERLREENQTLQAALHQRNERETSLVRRLQLLQGIFDALQDAVVFTDLKGQVIFHNAAAAGLLDNAGQTSVEGDLPEGTSNLAGAVRDTIQRVLDGATLIETVLEQPVQQPPGKIFIGLGAWRMQDEQGAGAGIVLLGRDVSEREALRDSEALYHSLVDSLPFCVFRKDRDGRFTYANQHFCALLDLPLEEVLGKTDDDFFAPELAAKSRQIDQRILETLEIFEDIEEHTPSACLPRCRCTLPGPDRPLVCESPDDRRYVQILLAPVFDWRKQIIGTQGAFWNVTPRLRAERELERTAAELQRLNDELARKAAESEQFAYIASHDLQEPLRTVASFTQLLKRRYAGKLDSDADEFIDFAVDGAKRMEQLIKDLLAYSRVGNRGQALEETDCQRVLETALQNLQVSIQESGAWITHDPLPRVRGDEGQLVQLFQNLIGNGLKFRRPGVPPRIHIGVQYQQGEWLFTIKDNGIGMEPRYLQQIFVIFKRLHTREQYPGSGIGLAICKKIVEHHGGRIWAESLLNRGSTFCFTLRSEWFEDE